MTELRPTPRGVSSRPLTDEEIHQVKQLCQQGMSHATAQALLLEKKRGQFRVGDPR